jgi:hypothetical protein
METKNDNDNRLQEAIERKNRRKADTGFGV